jgi:hypothetical protein
VCCCLPSHADPREVPGDVVVSGLVHMHCISGRCGRVVCRLLACACILYWLFKSKAMNEIDRPAGRENNVVFVSAKGESHGKNC